MCEYVCVCVFSCVCACVCVRARAFVCVCVEKHTQVHTCVCVTPVYVLRIHRYLEHTNIHTYVWSIHTYTHMCGAYTHTQMCVEDTEIPGGCRHTSVCGTHIPASHICVVCHPYDAYTHTSRRRDTAVTNCNCSMSFVTHMTHTHIPASYAVMPVPHITPHDPPSTNHYLLGRH
jgi:hypothetical protein